MTGLEPGGQRDVAPSSTNGVGNAVLGLYDLEVVDVHVEGVPFRASRPPASSCSIEAWRFIVTSAWFGLKNVTSVQLESAQEWRDGLQNVAELWIVRSRVDRLAAQVDWSLGQRSARAPPRSPGSPAERRVSSVASGPARRWTAFSPPGNCANGIAFSA